MLNVELDETQGVVIPKMDIESLFRTSMLILTIFLAVIFGRLHVKTKSHLNFDLSLSSSFTKPPSRGR